jgi:bifunctional non-homologous end joining protein LigD
VGCTRNGHDWTGRFPLIVAAAGGLKSRSCLIDGEAVACDGDGMPCFDRLRYRRQDGRVFLYAFDLIELDGRDLLASRLALCVRPLAALGQEQEPTASGGKAREEEEDWGR